jgi:hypothetical protein
MVVLTSDHYSTLFNAPQPNQVVNRIQFFSCGRLWSLGQALASYASWFKYDLLHLINSIPVNRSKLWTLTLNPFC